MVNEFPPKYQTYDSLAKFYIRNNEFSHDNTLWFEIFGAPTIFYKMGERTREGRTLICPHCGNQGVLMEKTTVSKKKYRYRYLYVYHKTEPTNIAVRASTLGLKRSQHWCFLNNNDQRLPVVQEAMQKLTRLQNIEKYFYKSLLLP
jgi:DNA-directed RNA polymerase subunit RPC12/RpoP